MVPPSTSRYRLPGPDGREVYICTRDGSDNFLRAIGSDFFGKNIPIIAEKYKKLGKQRGSKRKESIRYLVDQYTIIQHVASHCSTDVFGENIPESKFVIFLTHFGEVMDDLSKNIEWMDKGSAGKHIEELLNTITSLIRHQTFRDQCIVKNIDQTLAKVCQSASSFIDNREIPAAIVRIMCSLMHGLAQEKTMEQTLDGLRKNGLLYQGLRCFKFFSPQQISSDMHSVYIYILESIQKCPKLILSEFSKKDDLGCLLEIIANMDRTPSEITAKIKIIHSLANNMSEDNMPFCRTCGTTRKTIRWCSRCGTAPYCSSDCQKKDYKAHKEMCKAWSDLSISKKVRHGHEAMVKFFVEQNLYRIMHKVYGVCQSKRVTKKDLLVEFNYYDEAPALQGKFKIGLVDNYLHGNRPDEPDWFQKGTDYYEKSAQSFRCCLKDQYNRMTENNLLIICRYSDGSSGIHRYKNIREDTGLPMMTSDAMMVEIGKRKKHELERLQVKYNHRGCSADKESPEMEIVD